MTKSLTKLFTLIAVAGVVFFSSCKKSEDATVAAPTATLADNSTATNPSYEKGDQITYKLTASIPGGFKAGSGKKTVDGTDTPFNLTGINAGDSTISATFTVDVTEEAGKEVTVSVTLIDNSDQNVTAEAKYTVAAVGQGGGGAAPLLSGTATVSLGSESATLGSYLATSKGTSGVFKSSEAQANQADIDVTFGVGTLGQPQLISPDARVSAGLNAGNPAMTATRTTYFKAEANGPTDLTAVTALNVENNITASTGKTVQIAEGKTYSFVHDGATGKKGYIYVKSITGSGTNRTAEITFVVQQ
jgi:hypothetical protein